MAKTVIVSDDARLAAQLSSLLMTPGTYLPVLDGPRLGRPDRLAEIVRRNNVIARVQPTEVLLAGLSDEAYEAIHQQLAGTSVQLRRVVTSQDVSDSRGGNRTPLVWGAKYIGIGLLCALRQKRMITFSDVPSPDTFVKPKWGHLVVCEEGEELSEVIAANYAYALRAGLAIIPKVAREVAESISEALYSVDTAGRPRGDALRDIREQIRSLCDTLRLEEVNSITFISREIPFGLGLSEKPSTHLFTYPDLGIAVVNGLSAEQPSARATGIAAIIDPGTRRAPEIEAAIERLARRGAFVRGYFGASATVRDVSEAIKLFPYDLLLIATHCGDAPGYRWTYQFEDSEGHHRTLVVDIAIGVERTDDDDRFHVTEFTRFVSLDGVDWQDPEKKSKLYIGTAMKDYDERRRAGALEPTKLENIGRVRWSAAMKMYDGNFIGIEHAIAAMGTPIIWNNACSSWHRLGGNFTFAGARVYVGTLFPVLDVEAQEVTDRVLGKFFGQPLPEALWEAQREVYQEPERHPYIMIGAYPQRLQSFSHDVPARAARRLLGALRGVRRALTEMPEGYSRDRTELELKYYERELGALLKGWPGALGAKSGRRR